MAKRSKKHEAVERKRDSARRARERRERDDG